MRIGILGGSFDPVHQGHLKLAQAAVSELNLNKVIFVPANQNPLKRAPSRSQSRVRALRSAVKKTSPRFSVSLCELGRKGPSYTVDTLSHFKKRYPKDTLYFLSGADTIKQLPRWKSFDKIQKLARFVVMSRPGYRLSKAPKGVLTIPFDAVNISSTEVRDRIS